MRNRSLKLMRRSSEIIWNWPGTKHQSNSKVGSFINNQYLDETSSYADKFLILKTEHQNNIPSQ